MKIFREINAEIEKFKNSDDKNIYLGGNFIFKDFDAQDLEILSKTWTQLGETTFEKIIDGRTFWFDIILNQ